MSQRPPQRTPLVGSSAGWGHIHLAQPVAPWIASPPVSRPCGVLFAGPRAAVRTDGHDLRPRSPAHRGHRARARPQTHKPPHRRGPFGVHVDPDLSVRPAIPQGACLPHPRSIRKGVGTVREPRSVIVGNRQVVRSKPYENQSKCYHIGVVQNTCAHLVECFIHNIWGHGGGAGPIWPICRGQTEFSDFLDSGKPWWRDGLHSTDSPSDAKPRKSCTLTVARTTGGV